MDSYLSELNDIYNIETILEDKIFKEIERKLYDDSFVSHFKHAFIELNLTHINQLDYKLVETPNQKTAISNKLDSKITKVQILSELVRELQLNNFKQEFNIPEKLKEIFDIVLQKNNSIKIKNKYVTVANKLYDQLLDNSNINQIPNKSDGDTIYYDFLTAKIINKIIKSEKRSYLKFN